MATVTMAPFRCMMCGHEYEEKAIKGEDVERSCPKCRSNSIRHLKAQERMNTSSPFSILGRDFSWSAVPDSSTRSREKVTTEN